LVSSGSLWFSTEVRSWFLFVDFPNRAASDFSSRVGSCLEFVFAWDPVPVGLRFSCQNSARFNPARSVLFCPDAGQGRCHLICCLRLENACAQGSAADRILSVQGFGFILHQNRLHAVASVSQFLLPVPVCVFLKIFVLRPRIFQLR
jgi:hypothetical protein